MAQIKITKIPVVDSMNTAISWLLWQLSASQKRLCMTLHTVLLHTRSTRKFSKPKIYAIRTHPRIKPNVTLDGVQLLPLCSSRLSSLTQWIEFWASAAFHFTVRLITYHENSSNGKFSRALAVTVRCLWSLRNRAARNTYKQKTKQTP